MWKVGLEDERRRQGDVTADARLGLAALPPVPQELPSGRAERARDDRHVDHVLARGDSQKLLDGVGSAHAWGSVGDWLARRAASATSSRGFDFDSPGAGGAGRGIPGVGPGSVASSPSHRSVCHESNHVICPSSAHR